MLSIDHEIIQMPTHKIKKERNISRYGKLLCPGPLPSVGSSFITIAGFCVFFGWSVGLGASVVITGGGVVAIFVGDWVLVNTGVSVNSGMSVVAIAVFVGGGVPGPPSTVFMGVGLGVPGADVANAASKTITTKIIFFIQASFLSFPACPILRIKQTQCLLR